MDETWNIHIEKCIKIQTWKKSSKFSLYNILFDYWLKYIEMIIFFKKNSIWTSYKSNKFLSSLFIYININ
jgi:hypothetical protein